MVPLFSVRRNLLGVKVVDLLTRAPQGLDAQTHILCAPAEMSEESNGKKDENENGNENQTLQGQTENQPLPVVTAHRMHEMPSQDRIQNCIPKEHYDNGNQGRSQVNRND